MSPEPVQEPTDTLNTSNISDAAIITNESDSDEEEVGAAGYEPLPQAPVEGEQSEDENEDDEEIEFGITHMGGEPDHLQDAPESSVPPETLEVWSSSSSNVIELDENKINQVKSAMASFTLPSTAIPEWASSVSEDQWKDQLIQRLKKLKKDDI
ncbi:hypothetical protein TKK_0005655 [Trichogramma kaykai]|uniref:Male-enhanced antigen 1 n=1 Tax=Trichogramma kaykai TaxID=54128 RepID=A0ABD2XH52_9HYME